MAFSYGSTRSPKVPFICGVDAVDSCPLLPPSLVAQIICYNVSNLSDIANLRLISKSVGQLAVTMLPMVGNRIELLRSNERKDYVQKMIELDGFATTQVVVGERWLIDDGPRMEAVNSAHASSCAENLCASGKLLDTFKGAKVRQIFFLSSPVDCEIMHDDECRRRLLKWKTRIRCGAQRRRQHTSVNFDGLRQSILSDLHKTRTISDLQRLFNEAVANELQKPVYKVPAARRKAGEGAVAKSVNAPTMKDSLQHGPSIRSRLYRYPVLLSLDVPHDASCVEGLGDGWMDVIATVGPSGNDCCRRSCERGQTHSPGCEPTFQPSPQDLNHCFRGIILQRKNSPSSTKVSDTVIILMNLIGHADAVGEFRLSSNVDGIDDIALSSTTKLYQNSAARDGVIVVDGPVLNSLRHDLNRLLESFKATTRDDSIIFRELIDPTLFCRVDGVTKVTRNLMCNASLSTMIYGNASSESRLPSTVNNRERNVDFWGRQYEDTTYQMLPTTFSISENGKCHIEDYINNIVPRRSHNNLYGILETLFSQFLPYIEAVFSYAVALQPEVRTCEHAAGLDRHIGHQENLKPSHFSFSGQQLQVFTKVVEYVLKPGEYYDSAWKVEGMSHEDVVVTCMYVLDRDEHIVGGDLLMKRAFLRQEANYIASNMPNPRPIIVEWMVAEGTKPIGKIETCISGRLIVLPNSHISRMGRITNTGNATGRMTILIFYVVNPLRRIVSTREVAPQQQYCNGSMTLEEAQDHRYELIKIQRCSKQDWNVHRINLSEVE